MTRRLLLSSTAFAGAMALAAPGCGENIPPPLIVGVTPAGAYTDGPLVLRVDAIQVRPAVRLDVGRGGLATDLSSLRISLIPEDPIGTAIPLETADWDGQHGFWVRTPAALPAGLYGLELVDASGQSARFPQAFEGLGPDPDAPSIVVLSLMNNGYMATGAHKTVTILADDGPLGSMASIDWVAEGLASGTCQSRQPDDSSSASIRSTAPHQMTCDAVFETPMLDPGDPDVLPFSFRAVARDVAGNVAESEISQRLAKLPLVYMSDTVGALGGYQPFVVRGQHFLPGSKAYIGDVPIIGGSVGGDRPDAQSIVGWTPPHDRVEQVSVKVVSAVGEGYSVLGFTYLPPPRPRDIQPAAGPAHGGIQVTIRGNDFRAGVVIYIGTSLATRLPLNKAKLDAQKKVTGCVPAGVAGPASIWAYDPVTGDGLLSDAFTYQDDSASPAQPVSACQ